MISLLAIYLPFFTSVLMLWRGLGTHSRQVLCLVVALPALWLSLSTSPVESVTVPWLFLEAQFGLDLIRQVFLLFTSVLWAAAGLYAGAYLHGHPRERVFFFLYMLTMSGNIGLVLAEDIASFYTFFALMTFAAYGLILFDATSRARRAARVYIVMAVIGEAFILGAMLLVIGAAPSMLLSEVSAAVALSSTRDVIILLAFAGFGVKAGVLGLHMWLPLAHPVAPTPASAVLSGAMIKAGLLGWIHFLPLGHHDSEVWSVGIIVLGLAAAFGAVVVGVAQRETKTILAYSSISQMGVMTMAVGIGLASPQAWTVVLPVLAVYAFSHALAKGTLFLGVGIARAANSTAGRALTMIGLILAAAAIAGAPLTGGAVVKKALSDAISFAPGTWPDRLEWLLVFSAIATTVLLGRFLHLIWNDVKQQEEARTYASLWWAWTFCLGFVAIGIWLVIPYYAIDVALPQLALADAWDAVWPVALGAVLLVVWWRLSGRIGPMLEIPAGDMLIPVERSLRLLMLSWRQARIPGPSTWEINFEPLVDRFVESERKRAAMSRIEEALMRWDVAGLWFMILILVMAGLLIYERL